MKATHHFIKTIEQCETVMIIMIINWDAYSLKVEAHVIEFMW
jgi:hypothetical protein